MRKDPDMDTASRIRQFVTTNFYVADTAAFSNSASLRDEDIVDSTGLLEVIAFLEEEFGVKVEDDEIVPENLDSVDRIAAFVLRKTSGFGAPAPASTAGPLRTP